MVARIKQLWKDYQSTNGLLALFAGIIHAIGRFYQANKTNALGDLEMTWGFFLLLILPLIGLGVVLLRQAIRDDYWRKTELRPVKEHYENKIRCMKEDFSQSQKRIQAAMEFICIPGTNLFEHGGIAFHVEIHNQYHAQIQYALRLARPLPDERPLICPHCKKIEMVALEPNDPETRWMCKKCEHKAAKTGTAVALRNEAEFRFEVKLGEFATKYPDKLFRTKLKGER